jgi:V8-like Glu-specific endopeptidase
MRSFLARSAEPSKFDPFHAHRTWSPLGVTLFCLLGCGSTTDPGDLVNESDQELIYGTDDRLEYGQVVGTNFQYWANSTAALVESAVVSCAGATCALATAPWTHEFSTGIRLCNDVHYRGQPSLAYCSGFVVAPNQIVTAGHCLDAVACADTSFVFGFAADATGSNAPTSVPQENVYRCVSATNFFPGEDWAIAILDRPIAGARPPVNVRYTGQVAINDALAILGHPLGIPLKISPTGNVTETSATITFSHNVESFGGNSGSPVFDRITGVVQGIHVTPPASHFVSSSDAGGPCMAERVCPTTGCPGFSGATRITRLSNRIPLTPVLTIVATG